MSGLAQRLFALLIGVVISVEGSTSPDAWARHTIDNTSLGADGVRSMDMNGDDLPDLVTGWEQGEISRVYLMERGEQGMPEWKIMTVGAAPAVEDALPVDLDGDGAIDVVSSTEGRDRRILVHWGSKDASHHGAAGLWPTQTLWTNGTQWLFAEAMNIDGRNGIDLMLGGKRTDATVGWLESPEDPRDLDGWRYHPLTTVTWTMSMIPFDLNGDGLDDLIVSDRKGEKEGVFWLENPGPESARLSHAWTKRWIADDLVESTFVDVVELGDAIEIYVPHLGEDGTPLLTILRREGEENWSRQSIRLPGTANHPKSAKVADINLDGQRDVVVSFEKYRDPTSEGIIWLERDGHEWITHGLSGTEGIKYDLNLLLDLDNDGDLDVINTEENNNAMDGEKGLGLVWFENPVIE